MKDLERFKIMSYDIKTRLSGLKNSDITLNVHCLLPKLRPATLEELTFTISNDDKSVAWFMAKFEDFPDSLKEIIITRINEIYEAGSN
jgi:hypothetical protein